MVEDNKPVSVDSCVCVVRTRLSVRKVDSDGRPVGEIVGSEGITVNDNDKSECELLNVWVGSDAVCIGRMVGVVSLEKDDFIELVLKSSVTSGANDVEGIVSFDIDTNDFTVVVSPGANVVEALLFMKLLVGRIEGSVMIVLENESISLTGLIVTLTRLLYICEGWISDPDVDGGNEGSVITVFDNSVSDSVSVIDSEKDGVKVSNVLIVADMVGSEMDVLERKLEPLKLEDVDIKDVDKDLVG